MTSCLLRRVHRVRTNASAAKLDGVRRLSIAAALAFVGLAMPVAVEGASEVVLEPLEDRVRIEIGGELFTEYHFGRDGLKPYLYPVHAADGTNLVRHYPMVKRPDEAHDHPHHRALWFSHGSVNGHDFWAATPKSGRIVFERLLEAGSGPAGVLRARHRWESASGELVATDEVTVRVQPLGDARLLDYEITLHAREDGPLVFGDTKEGAMAIRLAQWMTMPHRSRHGGEPGEGQALTSAGARNSAAWGTRAAWADYFAPRGDKVYGVAIFDHPDNPRHPTWWHLRNYGLFAANPFGKHDFEKLPDQPRAGELVVPPGRSVTFRYRFYFHVGGPDEARVAERYRAYAGGR